MNWKQELRKNLLAWPDCAVFVIGLLIIAGMFFLFQFISRKIELNNPTAIAFVMTIIAVIALMTPRKEQSDET